ncbi:hypothetical protein C8Q77DRAFT_1074876 [Trametes polyzona]|nr:hypothetical protein C8Q77DRAFT_1074876 [Trametes polyzona]
MSAVAAHYAVAAPDGRYAAQYDPATFFSYSHNVQTAPLDPQYSLATTAAPSAAPYIWDAHEPSPYSSSASANAYQPPAAPAQTGHSSVTASFAYTAHADYGSLSSSHRSFPATSSRPAPVAHHAQPDAPPSSSHPSAAGTSSSARRSSYSSGARSYSSLAAAAATHPPGSSASSTPRLQNASWDSAALYTIEPADPVSHASSQASFGRSSTSALPSSPPIKEEDAEGEFIIELSVPVDPVPSAMPEVPLRATHAPPKMRSMMCSFRLESFAMHDGIRSAATQPGPGGIVVGPLKERPIEFEWQADLIEPLIPQEEENALRYAAASQSGMPRSHAHTSGRPTMGYTMGSPPPSRKAALGAGNSTMAGSASPRRARAEYVSAGNVSPALSLDYAQVDSDAWDASSAYGSVADNGSGSGTAATASPTFAPIMTPAQSLGWSLRYQSGEAEVEQSGGYHRQPIAQTSLSRVSQTTSPFMFGGRSGASKTQQHHSHHQSSQQAAYGYDTSGYSRGSGPASRYSEVYASSNSSAAWYR